MYRSVQVSLVSTTLAVLALAGWPHGSAVAGPLVSAAGASTAQAATDPARRHLRPFERLVGGEWHDGEGSWHEFEWGVRERVVRSRSFFEIDGEPTLVAEGMWFWHPGRREIVGYTVAVEMPVDLFEFTTTFEGDDRMVSDLVSYGTAGGRYREIWEFTDDDHYTWTLYQITDAGPQRLMQSRYERRP